MATKKSPSKKAALPRRKAAKKTAKKSTKKATGGASKQVARARKKAKATRAKSTQARTAGASVATSATDELALTERKKRARKVLRGLRRLYGDADCALDHNNAFELVVATILSAQSTDVNVNKVTPQLFRRYPTSQKLAKALPDDVSEIIRSTGFYRQKTKNIIGCAQILVDEFGGEVPQSIAELTKLPGVARKTANVVLGTWFGINEGVVVDTHVGRITTLLDLTWTSKDTKDAVKIERDLMAVVPQKDWTYFSHSIIWHGRQVCIARRPRCDECLLAPDCPNAFENARP